MDETCRVCGEPTSEFSRAVCSHCAQPYHLALRQDVPAKDCGQVWINEHHLSLEFACNACLAAEEPAEPPAAPAPLAERPARQRYVRREGVGAAELMRARRRRTR